MESKLKNSISHRGKALAKLKAFLNEEAEDLPSGPKKHRLDEDVEK